MKKLLYFATICVALAMFASCDDEKAISETNLPALSREFLKTHFAGVGTTRIVQEQELFDKDYTAYLANGFEIDFTKSGSWDEIDGHINALPQSILDLLPAEIEQYVNTTFPDCNIVKVNKECFGYDIELNNDIELEFNSNGEFVKID